MGPEPPELDECEVWAEIERLDDEISWLEQRIRADRGRVPELVLVMLDGRRARRQVFLLRDPWSLRHAFETVPSVELRVSHVADLWAVLTAIEDAIAWFSAWIGKEGLEVPDLIYGMVDALADMWEVFVASASAIAKEERAG